MKKSVIKANNLCKSFVTGKTALNVIKNLSLDIYEGDFTVIMGSSGSGKSTLLYTLSGMDSPTSGSVNILGKDITSMKENELSLIRKKDISFVFQSINLLPDITVFENIAYCGYGVNKNKKEVNEKTLKLLETLSIKDAKEKYPSEISGGMQQRAAVARAIITSPKILFGDEPTGALNSTAGEEVLDILSDLNNNGQTVVMVTHDLKAAARASRLIYLKDGRIDGELDLDKFFKSDDGNREVLIFEFLKERGW
ncbi:ABC transporter ATP-binding protein [Clostridium sp. CF011]|uniref:ABC transporter ATP-binding protein n=1 Tax=unclassified Clostridium TaxID=2614128 RepID=UPI001C0CAA07|nr:MULTISPECIES: ABC transporter ATP-binding protein [unclassified Clostridium]MBU3093476.1 ABC transporter ATP-binding protein [Clostridium sp. CF011]MBW9146680.1 ABC transporter ATP-binding protein [Clostridium sp. CM027]UVE41656.1 ABC transporter ATP-binding protein [Clostridium sp. CM027]WAG70652.1 ABC transporter ATP-binding protein [Clostridium sp. CF011]